LTHFLAWPVVGISKLSLAFSQIPLQEEDVNVDLMGGIYQLCQPEHGCVGAGPTEASAWLDG